MMFVDVLFEERFKLSFAIGTNFLSWSLYFQEDVVDRVQSVRHGFTPLTQVEVGTVTVCVCLYSIIYAHTELLRNKMLVELTHTCI